MAVSNTKALLKEMLKEINDAYARGQLDSKTQVVTLELSNIAEAWKEGYSNLLKNHTDVAFPDIDSINWIDGVSKDWDNIHQAIIKTKGVVVEYSPSVIVFKESKYTKNIHDSIKKFSVDYIQKQVGDYTLTDAKAEVQNNPSLSYNAAASLSDVGVIKKGSHRLHKGSTAVGAARLALAMKWISKTRFFKGFTSSKQAKSLEEVYGDIFTTFTTKGTKKKGLILQVTEDIKIEINAGRKNPRGGEATDWKGEGNIEQKLTEALLSWAEEAELAGVPGSSSIKDNAKNAVAYNIMSNFKSIKGAKTKTTATESTRGSKNVSVSKKSKSVRTSKKAAAKIARRSGHKKSPSAMPLYLIGVLNQQLPQVVAKNMETPALNYQTGRFASGVKVTDIIMTPQGFPSIGYTYDKYPYQTFEPGYEQGDPDRDPRKLINRSIREIAAQYAIGRFYTRRV